MPDEEGIDDQYHEESPKKEGKLHDIKETASDALEIIRELATDDARHSLGLIKEITSDIKEIVQAVNSPEMIKNIENIQIAAEAARGASSNVNKISQIMKESGIMNEAKEMASVVKSSLVGNTDTNMQAAGVRFGGSSKSGISFNLNSVGEVFESVKEVNRSISELVQELKLAAKQSRESDVGIVHNLADTTRDLHKTYENLKS